MRKFFKSVLFASSLFVSLFASAQLDTRHYIPPMYGREDQATGGGEDIYLLISTPQTTAFDVTITDGAGTELFTGITVSRSAPVTLALSSALGASKGNGTNFLVSAAQLANVQTTEGLILTANKAFFANVRVDENAQAASLTTKGTAGLGTEFRSGHVWNVGGNPGGVNARKAHVISFMASQDGTSVTVSDFGSVDFENINEAAQPVPGEITVSLDAGESYVLAAHVDAAAANRNDVNGTRITSTKPITVNSGSWLGGNPIDGNQQGRDIGIDQIASLEETGFEYILVKGAGNGNENVMVVASIDGTEIFLNGSSTPTTTLSAGDYYRYTSTDYTANDNMHIRSNQPVYVYQNLNGASSTNERQNGLNFIPPIVCLGGTNVDIPDADFTDAFGGTINAIIQIIGETGETVTITDEFGAVTDISASANAVTGNSNYVTYKVAGFSGNILVESPRPIRVALTIESGNVGAAGFFSGFTTSPVIETPNGYDASTCIPDNLPVVLEATGFDSYQWYRDNVKLTGETASSINVESPGEYTAAGTISGCLSSEQSFSLNIALCPADLGIAKNEVSVDNVSGSLFDVTYDLTIENFSSLNSADNVQIIENINSGLPSGASASLQGTPSIISGSFTSGGINPSFNGTTVTQLLQTATETRVGVSATVIIRFTVRIDMSAASAPTYINQAVVSTKNVGPNDGSAPDSQDFSDDGTDPDPDGDNDPTESGENDITRTCVSNTTISYDSPTYYTTGSDPTPAIVGYSGGDFSASNSGLTINPSTGEIDVSESIVGNYIVTYSFGGLCPTTTPVEIVLNPPTEPTVVSQTTNTFTPSITGSAVLQIGDILSVTVEGQTYVFGVDPELTMSGTTWTLALPGGVITADGTYNVDAIITNGGIPTPDTTNNELIIDTSRPSVDIQGEPIAVNTTTPYSITLEFDEDVVGFDIIDISVGNGSASNFIAVDGNTYTVDITPNGAGNITIDVVNGAAQDNAGNVSFAAIQALTIFDNTPPAVPTVDALTTNDPSPVLTGTAEAGSTVTLIVDGVTFETTADGSGDWSVNTETDVPTAGGPFADLADGNYEVAVTSTDAAGNSTPDGTNNELTVDTAAPVAPTVDALTTNDPSPVLTGTAEAGSTVTLIVDGVTFETTADGSGDWSVNTETDVPTAGGPFADLADGNYEVAVTSTDAAGNSTPDGTNNELTVDTAAPVAPTVDALTTNDPSPVLTGTAEAGSTVTLIVDGVTFETTADGSGDWSVNTQTDVPTAGGPFTDLTDGNYEVAVTSTDAAGNSTPDASNNELTVDTVAPAVPTVDALTTNDPSPVLTGTAEAGSTVTVVINGVTFETTANGSGDWSVNTQTDVPTAGGPFADLADGNYEVAVTSTDAAGNSTPDGTNNELTIDTAAPVAPTVDALTTNDPSPVLTGTAEAGSSVTLIVDGVTFETTADGSGDWSINTQTDTPTAGGPFADLADGNYEVAVTSTDAAGNSTPDASNNELTVDTAAPVAPTVDALTTNDPSPVLTGTAEAGSTVTVVINGVTFETTANGSGDWSVNTQTDVPTAGGPFADLADGNYEVAVTSTDAAGNSTPDGTNNELTIDTAAPVAPTVDALTTNDPSPVLTGTAEAGSTVTLIVDGVTFETTADGSGDWSVNTQTDVPTAGGPFADLVDGNYEVAVTSTDAAGNSTPDASNNELTVDTAAPVAPTVDALTTNDPSPVLTGTAEAGSSVTLIVDGVTFETTADGSGDWSINTQTDTPTAGGPFADLADGNYEVAVTSTDAAGNSTPDASNNELTVDTAAPVAPTVDALTTNDPSPVLTGSAEAGSTVTVVINGVTFETTADGSGDWSVNTQTDVPTAGGPFADLADGNYEVAVTSTDAAGNSTPDASNNELTVDTVAPAVPTVDALTTNDPSPVLTGTAEAGSTVTVVINGVTFETTADGSGNWSVNTQTDTPTAGGPFADLADGNYEVAVTSTDAAGNSTPDASNNELTVDTAAPVAPTVDALTTNDPSPVLTGTAEAGSTVTLIVDGVTFETTADGSGDWSINTQTDTPTAGGPFADLADGNYEVAVTSTDAAGNSTPDASNNELTVDTAAPVAPTVDALTTNDPSPVLTGTAEAGSTVTVVINGVTFETTADGSGDWSVNTQTDVPTAGGPFADLADGNYEVAVTSTDAAGNSTPDGTNNELTIDTAAPVAPTVDALTTNDPSPVLTGTAEAGSSVTLIVDGVTFETTADGSGDWSVNTETDVPTAGGPFADLADGNYEVAVTSTDAAGNSTPDGTNNELTVDTAAPVAPTVDALTTNDPSPVLTGTAEAGSTVTLIVDGVTFETTADGSGDWSVNTQTDVPTAGGPFADLADGNYEVAVTSTDAAGNSTPDASNNELTVDTVAPAVPTVDALTTNDPSPVLTGTAEAGSTVTLIVDGVTFETTADGSGDWSVNTETDVPTSGGPFADLADGNYEVAVTSTDAAGNSTPDASNNELTVDTAAPVAPTVDALTTNDPSPVLTGSAEAGSTVTVVINGVTFETTADGSGDWSVNTQTDVPTAGGPFADLADGNYEVAVTSTDAAGNSTPDASNNELTVDTVAPAVPTVDALTTNDPSPVLTGTAEAGSTVTVVINGVTFETTADGSGNWSVNTQTDTPTAGGPFADLADGNYEVAVTSTDAAGNSTPDASNNELTVDTAAPVAPTVDALTTNDPSPVLTGTAEAGSTVTLIVDGVTFETTADGSGDWSINTQTDTPTAGGPFADLADGNYEVAVTSTDAAGNSTPDASNNELTVDTAAPVAPTVDALTTNDPSPVLTGTAEAGSTVTVVINGVTFETTADGSGDWSVNTQTDVPTAGGPFADLADGNYEVAVTSTDAAGNSTPDGTNNELTIDTAAPVAPTVDALTTNDPSPVLTGTAEAGSSVTLIVDGVTFETTADGSGDWSVNTETDVPTAGGPFADLADGNYEVAVTSTDAAGNSTPDGTNNELTVDTAAPVAPTVDALTTNDPSPVLTGTAEAGSTVTLIVDGVTFETTADGSGDWSVNTQTDVPTAGGPFADLADGNYEVAVTSTDAAGNSTPDASNNELTVDTVAPAVPTVDALTTNDPSPVLTGTAEAGSTVTLIVDGVTFETTADGSGDWSVNTETDVPTSGGPFADLADGNYEVAVTSTDAAGNSTPDGTNNELTVDTAAPVAPTVDALTTNDPSPVLTGSAEAGSTVTVVINGVTFETTADGSGDWSVNTQTDVPTAGGPFADLADGNYEVAVTSTDAAGNSTPDASNNELTVDTVAPAVPTVDALTTNDPSPVLTGTAEAGSTVTVVINGVTFETTADGSGNWSVNTQTDTPTAGGPFADLADGNYEVAVTSTDAAGNSTPDASNNELTVDTAAPVAPTVDALTTNDPSPVLTGTAEAGSTVTLIVDGVTFETTADGSGDWSINTQTDTPTAGGPFADLADGNYEVAVTSTDAAGNSTPDASNNELTVDTAAPVAPTVDALTTNDPSPVLTGTAEAGSTVTLIVDGVTFETTADGSGDWSVNTETDVPTAGGPFADLADGNYEVAVTSTDAAGNSTPDGTNNELTIDTEAPVAPTVDALTTNNPSPVLTGTAEAGSTVTLIVDGVTFETTADGSGDWSVNTQTDVPTGGGPFADLADGTYDVSVTSTDAAGNNSSDNTIDELTIDTIAPAVPTISNLSTSNSSPALNGTAEAGSAVTVVINGVTFETTADGSGNWSVNTETDAPTAGGPFTDLADGSYDIEVTSTDSVGNNTTDSTTNELTIDSSLPITPTVDGLATNDPSPVLTGTAEAGNTVTVVINGVTFETTADGSGNWSIDTELDMPIAGGPFVDMTDGTYDIAVTATNSLGRNASDNTTDEIIIDTTAPVVPTVDALAENDPSPVLTGTAEAGTTVLLVINGVTFETIADGSGNWSVDTETDTPVAGGPFTDLSDGTYDISLTSTDAAGNSTSDATTDELTVDTTAPAIPTVNNITASDPLPVLAGTAEAGTTVSAVINGVTFETIADVSGNWTVNTETDTPSNGGPFANLPNGTYEIVVTSTDVVGNSSTDATNNELTVLSGDSDGDSIPDIEEDLDGDSNPDNDDTDSDGLPNYLDDDDDGDGVPTFDEDTDGDGDLFNDDCDDDGIPNFLDADQCSVAVIPMKGFTPDGNGENDFFFIEGIERYPTNNVQIYNRWGNRLFEVDGYNNQDKVWRGESVFGLIPGANEVPEGTYFYLVDLKNNSKPLSGFVVIRK